MLTCTKVAQCCIIYKGTQLVVPDYFIDSINLNNSRHTRNTRFSNHNFICPRYNRATEGGRTYLVQAVQTWNSFSAFIKKQASLKSFKRAVRGNFFKNN